MSRAGAKFMRDRRSREAQAREAKLERRQPVESPGGGSLLTGLLDDLSLRCEHGRPSWRMCPHCNGWSTPEAVAARDRVMALAQPEDGRTPEPGRCPHHDICDHSLTCEQCAAEGGPAVAAEDVPCVGETTKTTEQTVRAGCLLCGVGDVLVLASEPPCCSGCGGPLPCPDCEDPEQYDWYATEGDMGTCVACGQRHVVRSDGEAAWLALADEEAPRG